MTADMKAISRDTWERIWPNQDVEGLRATVAADVVNHTARPGLPPGVDGLVATMQWLGSAFSDQRYEIHRMVAEGDLLAVHLTHSGVHTGEFMGLPASGRPFAYQHMHMLRFRDGVTTEHWAVHDTMALLGQIGALPAPTPG